MKQKLKKGDHVVMHTCEEANFTENYGKVWICKDDQFIEGINEFKLVFLEGYPNSFEAKYLQLVNLTAARIDLTKSYINSDIYKDAVLSDLIKLTGEESAEELMEKYYDKLITIWGKELNSEHLALEIINLTNISKNHIEKFTKNREFNDMVDFYVKQFRSVITDIKMSFEEWKVKNYGENYYPNYDDNGVCDGTCDGCLRSDYVDYWNNIGVDETDKS